MTQSTSLEFNDIQGFAVRGFGKMPYAGYLMVTIKAPTKCKHWLKQQLEDNIITPATQREATGGARRALAFCASGMKKLLGDAWMPNTFPPEFIEGMVQEHRSRLLGDTYSNAPNHWRWGKDNKIDAVVLCFAENQAAVISQLDELSAEDNGMAEVTRIFAHVPSDHKEPFGFADGVSQPIIQGTDRNKAVAAKNPRDHNLHAVPAGEIILGYADGTGELPRSPAVSPAGHGTEWLQPHFEQNELKDLGRNGTFMVVRQLAQDVALFEEYIEKNGGEALAAKMVGRNKDGTPLLTDRLAKHDNDFDFLEDLEGKACPIGSHVRRTNPRSTVHEATAQGSLEVTNRHRILRRGRVYKNDDGEVGLLFVCLNACINRQFEFVQSTWANNPFFQGLAAEVDPLIGTQCPSAESFTMPAEPYRQKVTELKQWVTVKGGAYFFMPSLTALRVLAS